MKGLVKIWLFLLLGAAVAAMVQRDNGYVLLSYDVWTIELSLALLLLVLGLGFTLLYFLIRLMVRTWQLPAQVHEWNARRGARLAQRSLTRGLLEMSEGNWKNGEKYLVKHAERSETPLLNYLAAARAAQLQGEHDRRDGYLRLAHEHMPSADVAVSLTQAELQLADRQLEQALATLNHLRSIAPSHVYVLRLLSRLYEQLGDWEHLRELLPELRKRKVSSTEELARLELRTYRALLEQGSLSVEPTRLGEAWKLVPKGLRHNEELLADYAGYLTERGKDTDAEQLLREVLKKQWSGRLIAIYGLLDTPHPGQQLTVAEKWLETQPRNPELLLALGRLSLRAKLWGKARDYLEACIAANGPVEAYRELGYLLEQMDEQESALRIYRKGILGSAGPEPISLPSHIGKKEEAGAAEAVSSEPRLF